MTHSIEIPNHLQDNDQAHPPPEAGVKGGTTEAQAVGGRVQRLVVPMLVPCARIKEAV